MLIPLIAAAFLSIQPADDNWNTVNTNWDRATDWAQQYPVSTLRYELETHGGPLPFVIQFKTQGDLISDPKYSEFNYSFDGEIVNGHERIQVVMLGRAGGYSGQSKGMIIFPEYDSSIFGMGTGSCVTPSILPQQFLHSGSWSKKRGSKNASLNLSVHVVESSAERFDLIEDAGKPARFDDRWSVKFESSEDLAVGEFRVDENQIATGTFMTTTGDYRYLAGRVDGDLMRLSTFDGAHAFLFHARMQDDGTIEGDFWSGNWWHETWTAVRDDDAALPDAFEQTVIADEDALDDMVFKNLQGEPTRVLDVLDESNAPARIIEIFGTWCPNCSDAGRELVSLREQYGDDLAVVGLAFEVTEDFERSVQQVRHHHEHIGTDWPILIAGLSDKAKASQALPVLDKVRSYPTLIFLDRNNEVQGVYSGFSGPATGDAYTKQRERFEALIESMID
jgi:thiol-disulfide isomerase/thioredoxin